MMMGQKILVAVDQSENSSRAVDYVAKTVGADVQITLFHVLPQDLPEGLEKGEFLMQHSPEFKEKLHTQKQMLASEKLKIESLFKTYKETLVNAGLGELKVQIKTVEKNKGTARDILDEVRQGKYDTVVVGRRGVSATMAFLTGSISNKIIQHADEVAVWVIG